MSNGSHMDNTHDTLFTWAHTMPSDNRVELLITHLGNKVIDIVMLPVDKDGMPTGADDG